MKHRNHGLHGVHPKDSLKGSGVHARLCLAHQSQGRAVRKLLVVLAVELCPASGSDATGMILGICTLILADVYNRLCSERTQMLRQAVCFERSPVGLTTKMLQ